MVLRIRKLITSLLPLYMLSTLPAAMPQDRHILFSIDEVERRLAHEPFKVISFVGIRYDNDFTKRATLLFPDGTKIRVKWKRAPQGGDAPNNAPRYEIAAYEFQKLFLEPHDYVVPPTIGRAWPLAQYRELDPEAKPSFKGTDAVFFVMQYWLNDVTTIGIYDNARLKSNRSYAKHAGNLNIFTYLIKHMDSNEGNFLISIYAANMRLFAVDNSLAFGNQKSNRGTFWKDLRVKRLPRETIDRLRQLTEADIEKTLGVVAQYQIRDGLLVQVPPTENLDKNRGVRRSGNVIQFGLTEREIRGVVERWKRLLEWAESGKVQTFESQ